MKFRQGENVVKLMSSVVLGIDADVWLAGIKKI